MNNRQKKALVIDTSAGNDSGRLSVAADSIAQPDDGCQPTDPRFADMLATRDPHLKLRADTNDGAPDLLEAAKAEYNRGGAVVPIPRKGIPYKDKHGEDKETTGKGPEFTKGWLDKRLSWAALERAIKDPNTVALGIVGGDLCEGELHNMCTLDFDGQHWQMAYDAALAAFPELERSEGTITGSGKRHKRVICPDLPKGYGNKKYPCANAKNDAAIELRGRINTVWYGLHPSGGYYEPDALEADLVRIPFAELQQWLSQEWAGEKRKAQPAAPKRRADDNESLASKVIKAAHCLKAFSQARRDDYDGWLHAGMALHHELGEIGLPLWIEWSERSAKYHEGDCIGKWASFGTDRERKYRMGSLIQWAKDDRAASGGEGSTWEDLDAILGPLEWEWEQWLASGFLTMVAGASGEGKSWMLLYLADIYLRGKPFPDGTPYTGKTGSVVWVETESSQGLNLDRAKTLGIPLERIISPLDNPLDECSLDDAEHMAALERMAYRDDVRLVIIDSLSGGHRRDERRSSQMMGVVKQFATMARDTGKVFALSHHIRKRGMFDPEGVVTLEMVRGSGAIVQPCRLIWAVDKPDPRNDLKRLSVIKSNLALFPEPLGFAIDDNGLTFYGDAPEMPRTETLQQKAADLLLALLSDGPMLHKEIESEVKGAGLSIHAANRAKKDLGIVSKKIGDVWYWALRAHEEE